MDVGTASRGTLSVVFLLVCMVHVSAALDLHEYRAQKVNKQLGSTLLNKTNSTLPFRTRRGRQSNLSKRIGSNDTIGAPAMAPRRSVGKPSLQSHFAIKVNSSNGTTETPILKEVMRRKNKKRKALIRGNQNGNSTYAISSTFHIRKPAIGRNKNSIYEINDRHQNEASKIINFKIDNTVTTIPSYEVTNMIKFSPHSGTKNANFTHNRKTHTTTISMVSDTKHLSQQSHVRLQPSQTISLPTLTAVLYADSSSPFPTYGHPPNESKVFHADPFMESQASEQVTHIIRGTTTEATSNNNLVLLDLEPYLLPYESPVLHPSTSDTPDMTSSSSTAFIDPADDSESILSDVENLAQQSSIRTNQLRKRRLRHNSHKPYGYRELHSGSRRDNSTEYLTQPDDDHVEVEYSNELPDHEPYQDDHSANLVSASEHDYDRYRQELYDMYDLNDVPQRPKYDHRPDTSGLIGYFPHTGSGTRLLYTEPIIDAPKFPNVKDGGVQTNAFGRHTKTKSSSVMKKDEKKDSVDNQKELFMMVKLKEIEDFKMQEKNNEKKKVETGKDMVMGDLMPVAEKQVMPKIKALDVVCTKEMINVTLQFDKEFSGVIYSKGFFGQKECVYVQNDKKKEYKFMVPGPTMCGTTFVKMKGKHAFLENVIIVQNHPGIQEVWDSARGIRCLFDGQIQDASHKVTAALSVAKIDQQVMSFSADTKATAKLDIQVGKGPFAAPAAGLVKIGELMTLVVTVEGPEKVGVLVRKCVATDGHKNNSITLTDQNGCVVKKKLMGSWQVTKQTRDKKKPVIAFAHFQAFKFPDQMEVMIECQVDLCSGDCDVCHEDMKKTIEKMAAGQRRRRALSYSFNDTTARPSIPSIQWLQGVNFTEKHFEMLLGPKPAHSKEQGSKKNYQEMQVKHISPTHSFQVTPISARLTSEQSPDTGYSFGSAQQSMNSTGNLLSTVDSSINDTSEFMTNEHAVALLSTSRMLPVSEGQRNSSVEMNYSRKLSNQNDSDDKQLQGSNDIVRRTNEMDFYEPSAEVPVNVILPRNSETRAGRTGRLDGVVKVANSLQVFSPETVDYDKRIENSRNKLGAHYTFPPGCSSLTQLLAASALLIIFISVVVFLVAVCLQRTSVATYRNSLSALPDEQSSAYHAYSSLSIK